MLGRVGKTSLAQQYIRSSFSEGQAATVQAAFFTKTVRVQGQEASPALSQDSPGNTAST